MSENKHDGPPGPHKHPNIRPARGTPNFPEDKAIQEDIDPRSENRKSSEEMKTEFNELLLAITNQTGLSEKIILKAIALTSNQTPLESLENWKQGDLLSRRVVSLFLRQAKVFSKNPKEVIEIAKTEKWIE
jgi:hypothetical protein